MGLFEQNRDYAASMLPKKTEISYHGYNQSNTNLAEYRADPKACLLRNVNLRPKRKKARGQDARGNATSLVCYGGALRHELSPIIPLETSIATVSEAPQDLRFQWFEADASFRNVAQPSREIGPVAYFYYAIPSTAPNPSLSIQHITPEVPKNSRRTFFAASTACVSLMRVWLSLRLLAPVRLFVSPSGSATSAP